jgi:hypothetical protein
MRTLNHIRTLPQRKIRLQQPTHPLRPGVIVQPVTRVIDHDQMATDGVHGLVLHAAQRPGVQPRAVDDDDGAVPAAVEAQLPVLRVLARGVGDVRQGPALEAGAEGDAPGLQEVQVDVRVDGHGPVADAPVRKLGRSVQDAELGQSQPRFALLPTGVDLVCRGYGIA